MDPFCYLCFLFVMLSCLVVNRWKRANLLALLYVMFACVFVTFPCGVLRRGINSWSVPFPWPRHYRVKVILSVKGIRLFWLQSYKILVIIAFTQEPHSCWCILSMARCLFFSVLIFIHTLCMGAARKLRWVCAYAQTHLSLRFSAVREVPKSLASSFIDWLMWLDI